ncbi:phage antirepressor KilAC domain-containing protein [Salmonella enterica]
MMIRLDNLSTRNVSATMSSREIAKLLGVAHNEVKRMVKSLETAQRLSQPLATSLYEREGEMRQEFLLNKRDSLLTVARISPAYTAEMLDRWQEREKELSLPDFTNPAAAARAWAEQYERCLRAEEQLALFAPKAEFFDAYIQVDESLSFRQLCKLLKAKEAEFRQFLLERNIMQRINGTLMPAQHHIQAGYFTVHAGSSENRHNYSQARFTSRGVKWVAALWATHLSSNQPEIRPPERKELAQGPGWF